MIKKKNLVFLHEESVLCHKLSLASDVSGCFMRQFLQGWPNSHVLLFLPEIRDQQVGGSLYPCETKSTVLGLWDSLVWIWIGPQGRGSLVCNHIGPELDSVKSMRALPLSSKEVGLCLQWVCTDLLKEMWYFESFFVSSRENSTKLLYLGFTSSLLSLLLLQ